MHASTQNGWVGHKPLRGPPCMHGFLSDTPTECVTQNANCAYVSPLPNPTPAELTHTSPPEMNSRHHANHAVLRVVKDWVHMKTAKMMQDFNWYCNLDVNHKLLLLFIIKVVYLSTLHNKIISPAHFVVYMLWWPTSTWFSNINA